MNRRVTGILGAAVLAVVGTIILSTYVQSARNDAAASGADVDVWIVDEPIAKGTAAVDIEESISRTKVPKRVEADGAIKDLEALDGLVANTDLHPGDQLTTSRFGTPSQVRYSGIPSNLHGMTIKLSPERALGGQVRPGDRVDVVMSYDLASEAVKAAGETKASGVMLRNIQVTSVQISPDAQGVPEVTDADSTDADAVADAPTETLLVTLAVDDPSVERLVLGAEFGTIWLVTTPAGAAG